MKLSDAFAEFLNYQKVKGNSPRTVVTYRRRFRRFMADHEGASVEDITPVDVDAFLMALADREEKYVNHPKRETVKGGLSPSTINGYKQTLRTFFRFCLTRDYIDKSPAAHVVKKRVKRKRMVREKMMRRDDFERLLDEAEERARDGDPQPLALVTLLAESAARAGEIAGMKMDGLYLEEHEALVNGKSGERTIVFGAQTVAALEQWLKHRQYVIRMSGLDDPGHVFINTWPPAYIGHPATTNTISSIIRNMGKQAGIEGPCSPHAIRHLVATHLANTAPLALVQKLLGHADITTTMVYVWPDISKVKALVGEHGLLAQNGG